MLSRSARSSLSTARQLSQSQLRRASSNSREPLNASVAGMIFKLAFYGSVAYGVGATVALNYEPFQEYFFQIPYGEESMDGLEYAWKHRQQIYNFDYSNFFEEKKSNLVDEYNSKTETLGLDSYISIPKEGVKAVPIKEETKKEVKDAKKDIQQEKKEQFIVLNEATKAPTHTLPTISIKSDDPELTSIVASLNKVIVSINNNSVSMKTEKIIDSITSSLSNVDEKYQKLITSKAADLNELKNAELAKLERAFADKTVILTKEMTEKLEEQKLFIQQKYAERMGHELDETKKTLALEAQNVILNAKNDMIDSLTAHVSQIISNERDGKLKDLDALSSRISKVESLELELSKTAASFQTYKQIKKSVSKLQYLLSSNESSATRGTDIVSEINNLKQLTAPLDNELINATLASFPSDKELLTSGGVLTQSQLISRWALLAPELRSVSLLPENAGILGYLSSAIFSKFLLKKNGIPHATEDKLIGNDVESVIARVNTYLQKNQLDNAVEEVSSLKGATDRLSQDWLQESRKKLELQFLVELLDAEIHITA